MNETLPLIGDEWQLTPERIEQITKVNSLSRFVKRYFLDIIGLGVISGMAIWAGVRLKLLFVMIMGIVFASFLFLFAFIVLLLLLFLKPNSVLDKSKDQEYVGWSYGEEIWEKYKRSSTLSSFILSVLAVLVFGGLSAGLLSWRLLIRGLKEDLIAMLILLGVSCGWELLMIVQRAIFYRFERYNPVIHACIITEDGIYADGFHRVFNLAYKLVGLKIQRTDGMTVLAVSTSNHEDELSVEEIPIPEAAVTQVSRFMTLRNG